MDESEPDYEDLVFGTVGGKTVSTIEKNAIFNYLQPKEGELILDVGTGTGRIARAMVNLKANVVGIDPNSKRMRSARKRKKSLGHFAEKYDLIVADGHFLPFKDSVFDAIVCVRVLKYYHTYTRGIEEMSRVLKFDGRLVLSLSNILSVDFFLRRFNVLAYQTLFRFKVMKEIFLQNNLVIIEYLGLHKIHHKVWTYFKSPLSLKLLKGAEFILQKITPKELFSRELLLQLEKRCCI